MFDLSGRVALVTGAGQGMGLGVARALARQGAKVAINDYYGERAEAAVAALRGEGLQAMAAPGDITQAPVREAIVDAARTAWGEVDILVNNAGVPPGMPNSLRQLKDLKDEDFEIQLDLNLRAIVGLTRLVVDGMCERGWGRIVIVSSEFWRIGMAMGLSNYAAAKAAALGFMRHLAHEVGRHGVTANAVSLGAMNNFGYDEIARRTTAVGRAGTPDDVGAAVVYLASAEAAWYTGQVMALNGGSLTA
ncbi:MAG: SDR family NAD(P)-dependent oxidoreductase [Burkholderiales bacterium]|nr:SDR family NAD(P)-dependent oxidoreductase [Burkholderiales bacterium]MDE1927126.1 SDR family NAD(P)-dependent oxidoreductase [Burkholderiales bacterium]MDE2158965.1 SDR family NAD(P)-dependent oxidoreductase [Burkholderiales bacterium]MDE2503642.1 SDR family NAD(P)-dependent oxidoreductase [Burkholderiales bacterium]